MNLNRLALLSVLCTTLSAGPLDNWHSRTNFGFSYLNDIAYHDGKYVIVNTFADGAIITATNLANPGAFAVHRLPEGKPNAVEFGAGRFVVTPEGGAILSSTNGYDWVSHGESGLYYSLLFAGGKFVAVGNRRAAVSTNGTDWVFSDFPERPRNIAFGNGVYVVAGLGSNAVSSDGVNWEAYKLPSNQGFYTVGFGEGKFVGVVVGAFGDNVVTSNDGRNWTFHGRLDVMRPGAIAWGNGYLVTAGGGARAYSRDGISWTVVSSGTTEYHVEFIQGRFIALGYKTLFESEPVIGLALGADGRLQILSGPIKDFRLEAANSLDGEWAEINTVDATGDPGRSSIVLPISDSNQFFRTVIDE